MCSVTNYTLRQKVRNFAIASRIVVILLQAVSNWLIPDHQADAFISPEDPELHVSIIDKLIKSLLGGLIRWDAQYFIHIAQYGYTHENTLAFFPLYPLLVRFVAMILSLPLKYICNQYSMLLISAVLINFVIFVKSATVFHRLSEVVVKSEVVAYRSSLLYCINPASIFFTAPYSEALFALLTFYALLINETKSTFLAALPFGLASSCRSNGLVNTAFIIHRRLRDCYNYFWRIRNATTENGQLSLALVLLLTFNYTLMPLIVGCIMVALPFIIFQVWCYYTYCSEEGSNPPLAPHLEMYVRSNFLHSPDLGEAEWCYNFPPLAYSHVQDKYWEVGFLRYYEVRQVPNFMLALPVVMLVICHAALYMVDNPQVCWGLGILPQSVTEQIYKQNKDKKNNKSIKGGAKISAWLNRGINSWRVFSYTAHSLSLCAFCVLCIHVQVTTRLLCSSCPIVYWFAAHLLSDAKTQTHDPATDKAELPLNMTKRYRVWIVTEFPKSFWGQVVVTYFYLYFFMGIILFSNFLPWT